MYRTDVSVLSRAWTQRYLPLMLNFLRIDRKSHIRRLFPLNWTLYFRFLGKPQLGRFNFHDFVCKASYLPSNYEEEVEFFIFKWTCCNLYVQSWGVTGKRFLLPQKKFYNSPSFEKLWHTQLEKSYVQALGSMKKDAPNRGCRAVPAAVSQKTKV